MEKTMDLSTPPPYRRLHHSQLFLELASPVRSPEAEVRAQRDPTFVHEWRRSIAACNAQLSAIAARYPPPQDDDGDLNEKDEEASATPHHLRELHQRRRTFIAAHGLHNAVVDEITEEEMALMLFLWHEVEATVCSERAPTVSDFVETALNDPRELRARYTWLIGAGCGCDQPLESSSEL